MTAPADSLRSLDRWGPFEEGLPPAERVARFRCLVAIVHLLTGSRGAVAKAALRAAEADPAYDVAAHRAVMALAPIDMRKVLGTYAAVSAGR